MQSLLQVRCDFPPTKANVFESVSAVALERKHGTNARVGGYIRPMFCTHRWGTLCACRLLRFGFGTQNMVGIHFSARKSV